MKGDTLNRCMQCGHTYSEGMPRCPFCNPEPEPPMRMAIREICDEVREVLLEKNRMYGDSLANPVNVFHKGSTLDGINARIDDKLARIRSAQTDDAEDAELDLIGYLIMKRAIKRMEFADEDK